MVLVLINALCSEYSWHCPQTVGRELCNKKVHQGVKVRRDLFLPTVDPSHCVIFTLAALCPSLFLSVMWELPGRKHHTDQVRNAERIKNT